MNILPVQTGEVMFPAPSPRIDMQRSSTREAGREPSRETSFGEGQTRPRPLPPGSLEKLREILASLKQLEHSGTADTKSLHEIETNILSLKKGVFSDIPEADAAGPHSTSIHSVQSTLTLLGQRAHPNIYETRYLNEIQVILNRLETTALTDEQPAADPNMRKATGTATVPYIDNKRDRIDLVGKITMSNGKAATSGGQDADLLANEIHRHQETKQSLLNNEATVKKLYDELAKVNALVEDFRYDKASLKLQVDELEEDIRERESERQRLEAQIRGLEADAAPQVSRLEKIQGELETERSQRVAAQTVASQREIALREAVKQIGDLEKRAQENATRLKEKDEELAMLQEQLRQATEDIAQRDRKLRSSAAEKRHLKEAVTEADGHLQETAAVIGETVLNLDSELERLMTVIRGMKVATKPQERRQQRRAT